MISVLTCLRGRRGNASVLFFFLKKKADLVQKPQTLYTTLPTFSLYIKKNKKEIKKSQNGYQSTERTIAKIGISRRKIIVYWLTR
jgi:hypothetical protein